MNPGALWHDAKSAATPEMMARVASLLHASAPDDAQLAYILAPFVPYRDGEQWLIAAITTPCPVNAPECILWQPDGDVILIDPNKSPSFGRMRLLGDDNGWLVPPADAIVRDGDVRLYGNGVTFARDWCAERALWIDGIARDVVPGCRAEPPGQPGVALCGDLASVVDLSPVKGAPRVVVDDPRLMRALTRKLLEDARLPVVDSMPARLRVAA